MTENTQPPKLKWKDKEYEQSSLTDQQKYLFAQLMDIQKKRTQCKVCPRSNTCNGNKFLKNALKGN